VREFSEKSRDGLFHWLSERRVKGATIGAQCKIARRAFAQLTRTAERRVSRARPTRRGAGAHGAPCGVGSPDIGSPGGRRGSPGSLVKAGKRAG
jgi:hypothetical protein